MKSRIKIHQWGKVVLVLLLALGTVIGNLAVPTGRAAASSAEQVYLGEIRLFPYGRAPAGWTYSDGRTLSIAQNQALFSLMGVQYGGNGRDTFALPNLRGVSPVVGAAYYISTQGIYPSEEAGTSFASVGEVKLFPYTRPTLLSDAWIRADGRQVSSAQFPALYNRIGNAYGGDASAFNLPKLNNPSPMLADGLYYAIAAVGGGEEDSDYMGALVPTLSYIPEPYWMPADGRLQSIAQNQVLFALFGTKFGGNGQTTFGLPNIPKDAQGVTYYVVMNGMFPNLSDSASTPNDARAVNDSYQVSGSLPLSVPSYSGVLRNDNYVSSAHLISGVQHGSLTLRDDGSFDYTASGGFRGEDSFTYQAYNSNVGGSTATVTLKIIAGPAVISGVSSGAYYSNDVTPTYSDGVGLLDGQPFSSGARVSSEGTHTLQVTNDAGSVSVTFTIDKTAPVVTGVQNGETYHTAPKISFNEGTAVLNGAPFTSNTVVTTDGTYTLVVTDPAGHVTTVQFVVDQNVTVTFDADGGSA